jgi:hypothetical protein
VPADCGAVYRPLVLTLPPVAFHDTAVLAVPVTEAVNCCLAAVCRLVLIGERVIPTPTGGGAATVTRAEADLVASAALVAVTVYVLADSGAVYIPLALMLPPLAFQVTAVLLVPLTEAVNCLLAPVCRLALVGERAIPRFAVEGVAPTAVKFRYKRKAHLVAHG